MSASGQFERRTGRRLVDTLSPVFVNFHRPPGNVAQQMGEKLDDLPAADRSWEQLETKIPTSHLRHRRWRLPGK